MKKLIVGALVCIFIAGGVQAQDQQPGRKGFHKGRGQYGMMNKLNLTDDQKTQMKSINEEFRKQFTELKKNEDITVREWKSKMQSLSKDHQSKVQGVLTTEQKATLDRLKQERKDNFKAGRKGFQHKGRKGGDSARYEKMKTELGLTAEQADALQKGRAANFEKMKALREDKSLNAEQKKVEFKKLRDQQRESFKSILTPEQLKKLEQMKPHRQKPVQ